MHVCIIVEQQIYANSCEKFDGFFFKLYSRLSKVAHRIYENYKNIIYVTSL